MLDFEKQIIGFLASKEDPVKLHTILKHLGFGRNDRQYLRELLGELVKSGKVVRDGNRFWVPDGKRLSLEIKRRKSRNRPELVGRLTVNQRGFGFVANNKGEDWFIPPHGINGAKSGDTVRVVRTERGEGGRNVAEVLEILDFGTSVAVGVFVEERYGVGFIPFGDLQLERDDLRGVPTDAAPDQVARFERRDDDCWYFGGYLGKLSDPKVDEIVVLTECHIEEGFSPEVEAQCADLDEHYPFELSDRKDFRDQMVFTVDGETARDFDDALHFREIGDGNIEVGIHIADVSHFVKPDSPLDLSARARGNSTYLTHRAIPMLPEILSNELCSLKPHVPRYTISLLVTMDREGNTLNYSLHKGLIQSAFRLTYNQVVTLGIEKDAAMREEYAPVVPFVDMALMLSRRMRDNRIKAGGLKLDMAEVVAVLDEEQNLKEMALSHQTDANRMIEAFMCLANECVAEYMEEHGIGTPYRIHQPPDGERLEHLATFWEARGFEVPQGLLEQTGPALNQMIEKLIGTPSGEVLQLQVLKSLKLAEYSSYNAGHFGLASTHYAHFTSPIRRYADLMIHQRLSVMLRLKDPAPEHFDDSQLDEICAHISEKERSSARAEQTFVQIKLLRYLQNEVGNIFDGVIMDAKPYGLFVRLEPLHATGLVHTESLTDDYYFHNPESLALVGKRSGKEWLVGDPMRVRVLRVDLISRKLDLNPEDQPPQRLPGLRKALEEDGLIQRGRGSQRRESSYRSRRRDRDESEDRGAGPGRRRSRVEGGKGRSEQDMGKRRKVKRTLGGKRKKGR